MFYLRWPFPQCSCVPRCMAKAPAAAMSLGQGASLNGFIPFPADNLWNQNIFNASVDPNSDAIINFIGASTPLHPDFGAGLYQGSTMGIPYVIVSGSPFVNIHFTAYGSESDPGPMPIPHNAPIEGYPHPGNGDRHVLVLDRDNCWLYELYYSYPRKMEAGTRILPQSGICSTTNSVLTRGLPPMPRGFPSFAGLARYDEVASGQIQHALRFTLQYSRRLLLRPHRIGRQLTNSFAAPMGMRLRLKASYDISSFPPQAQVILTALKQYGMIMADNGSSMFVTGDPDNRWSNDDLGTLKQVPASAFEYC